MSKVKSQTEFNNNNGLDFSLTIILAKYRYR